MPPVFSRSTVFDVAEPLAARHYNCPFSRKREKGSLQRCRLQRERGNEGDLSHDSTLQQERENEGDLSHGSLEMKEVPAALGLDLLARIAAETGGILECSGALGGE